MPDSLVQVRVDAPAGTIVINRPEKRNALSRNLIDDLQQALDDLYRQRNVRAVILTGAGSVFCAGMDLGEMLATAQGTDPHPQWQADAIQYRDLLETMLRYPKPIISAVNGPAMAGGAGLLLASDIVIATPEARFGLPEPRRGLVAGIVSPMLVFRIGAGHAARLLLTAQSIEADEAHRLGIYHEIIEFDLLWARACEICKQCAEGAAEALLLTKQMLNQTIGEPFLTMLSAGAAVSATARTTEAAAEGIAAFLEKREPNWP